MAATATTMPATSNRCLDGRLPRLAPSGRGRRRERRATGARGYRPVPYGGSVHRILAASVAVLTLAAACGEDESPTAASTTTMTTAAAEDVPADDAAETTVELLDPGSEPRRELRLDVEEGATQDLVMTQVQEQTFEIGGQSQGFTAATEQAMRVVVDSLDDDTMTTTLTFGAGRVLDDPPVDAATRAGLEQVLALLDGLEGTTVSDLRGRVLDVELPVPPDAPAELRAVLEPLIQGLDSQASQLSVAFPEEPVGVGARWRTTTSVVVSGLGFDVVTDVTLTELGDGTAAAEVTPRLTIVPGTVEMQGVTFEVVEGEMSGTGTTRWDLSRPLPASEQDMSGTVVLAVSGNEVRQSLRTQLSMRSD